MFVKDLPEKMRLQLKHGGAVDPDSGLSECSHVLTVSENNRAVALLMLLFEYIDFLYIYATLIFWIHWFFVYICYIDFSNTLIFWIHWFFEYIDFLNTLIFWIHWYFEYIDFLNTLIFWTYWFFEYIDFLNTLIFRIHWFFEYIDFSNSYIDFSNTLIFLDVGFEWYFMLTSNFCAKKIIAISSCT